MVIFAGRDSSQNYFNDLYALDLQTRKVDGDRSLGYCSGLALCTSLGTADPMASNAQILSHDSGNSGRALSLVSALLIAWHLTPNFFRMTVATGPNSGRDHLPAVSTFFPHVLPEPRRHGDLRWLEP